MVEAELVRGRLQANPATNPAGCCTNSTLDNRPYKDTIAEYPIHQLQENQGVNWIVIDNDIVHGATNSYYQQTRLPNGDIYLKQIDIFR
jgi:hypothetical protein